MEPKFCHRCGHALDKRVVDDGHTRPVCPACGHIIYLNPPIAAGVIVERDDGKILLVLRGENPAKGLWCLPAGFMEVDETVEQAAQRECREETGLEVVTDDLVGVWSYFHREKGTSGVLVVYTAHIVGGELHPGSDSAEVRFFAPTEIPEDQLAFSTHRAAIAQWRSKSHRATVRARVTSAP